MDAKPGWKCSEAWFVAGMWALALLNKKLGLDLSDAQMGELCALVGGYIAHRYFSKKDAAA